MLYLTNLIEIFRHNNQILKFPQSIQILLQVKPIRKYFWSKRSDEYLKKKEKARQEQKARMPKPREFISAMVQNWALTDVLSQVCKAYIKLKFGFSKKVRKIFDQLILILLNKRQIKQEISSNFRGFLKKRKVYVRDPMIIEDDNF